MSRKRKFGFVEYVLPLHNNLQLRDKILRLLNKNKHLSSGSSYEFSVDKKTGKKTFNSYCIEIKLKHEEKFSKLLRDNNIDFTIRRDDELFFEGEGIEFPINNQNELDLFETYLHNWVTAEVKKQTEVA